MNFIFALEHLPEDIRDFSHSTLFGTVKSESIPSFSFDISSNAPYIYDQSDLDFCTGESSSAESTVEFQTENDPSDPLFQFAKIKQIRGEWSDQGANLRDAAKALTKFGSLPMSKSPFTHNAGKDTDRDRDFLANWSNWPNELDSQALGRRLGSYFVPDGPHDPFDNIRSALWQNATTKAGSGVLFGLLWRDEWTYSPGGVIPEIVPASGGGGHAVYLRGQKMIGTIPYIVLQNSWGKSLGDNGLYYVPRSVINNEFAAGHGAYVFKKIPASQAKTFIEACKA